jgi:hypothetical protein
MVVAAGHFSLQTALKQKGRAFHAAAVAFVFFKLVVQLSRHSRIKHGLSASTVNLKKCKLTSAPACLWKEGLDRRRATT